MTHVRIAMRGWSGAGEARSQEETDLGVGCTWIEVDGVRIPNPIMSASVQITPMAKEVVGEPDEHGDFDVAWVRDDVSAVLLTIELAATAEIVYTDGDGVPLPGATREIPSENLDGVTLDHSSAVDRDGRAL